MAATRHHQRIAVTGVSRHPDGHGGNVVYQRLRAKGYEVFAVNSNADEVEGDPCYRDLKSIAGGVDAVVIGTRPDNAEEALRECAELGIKNVWMHRSFGGGSRFRHGYPFRPRARNDGHRRRLSFDVRTVL